MPGTNITIDDIAEALGVSKTTVSRAISGKGRISASTTERVQAYIREHNYKPNAVARSLAKQRTYNIGVVCPTDYEIFELQFFHRCLLGISEVTMNRGYDILISMITGDDIRNLKRIVEDRKVDGVILTRTMFNDPPAEYLKESGIPFVVIGNSPDEDLIRIDNDHIGACAELTSILIGKGFKRLALVGRDENQVITDSRRRGFFKGFENLQTEADPELLYMDAENEQKIAFILQDAIGKHADAIICMDEKITELMLEACRAQQVRIPDDIRIASFYNSAFLENSVPAITAINIDDRKLGSVAAETLLANIRGGELKSQFLKNYQIILRESTI